MAVTSDTPSKAAGLMRRTASQAVARACAQQVVDSRAADKGVRSYWIPGSWAPALSEKRNLFLSLLKNKDSHDERMTKVGLYALGTSTTLESNKSLDGNASTRQRCHVLGCQDKPGRLTDARIKSKDQLVPWSAPVEKNSHWPQQTFVKSRAPIIHESTTVGILTI